MVVAHSAYTPQQPLRIVPPRTMTRKRTLQLALLRRIALLLAGLLMALALMASSAAAQERSAASDSKMWYGLSVGGGNTRIACDICDPSRDAGPSVALSFGAYAAPHLRIGVEASRWSHSTGDAEEAVNALGLVAHLAMPAWKGLYLIGGGGWSGYRSGPYRSDAPRVTLGIGYDVPIAGAWVVGNVLSFDASWPAAIKNDDTPIVQDAGLSTVRIGLQLHRR